MLCSQIMEEPTRGAPLAAPFPYFGGKSLARPIVWTALGNPVNYVEPFAGSAAMLLGRDRPGKVETINDSDGFVANFLREECRRRRKPTVGNHLVQPALRRCRRR